MTLIALLLGVWFPTLSLLLWATGRNTVARSYTLSVCGGVCWAYVGIVIDDVVIKCLAAAMLLLTFYEIDHWRRRRAHFDAMEKRIEEIQKNWSGE